MAVKRCPIPKSSRSRWQTTPRVRGRKSARAIHSLSTSFFSEIEKAEEIELSKPLPQERLRNKRRLDREAAKEAAPEMDERARQLKSAFDKRRTTKTSNPDTVTGMSKRAPKSKANSVERPSNLPGFEEAPQAGFGHMPAHAPTSAKGVAGSSVSSATPRRHRHRRRLAGADRAWPQGSRGRARLDAAPPRSPREGRRRHPLPPCLRARTEGRPADRHPRTGDGRQ